MNEQIVQAKPENEQKSRHAQSLLVSGSSTMRRLEASQTPRKAKTTARTNPSRVDRGVNRMLWKIRSTEAERRCWLMKNCEISQPRP